MQPPPVQPPSVQRQHRTERAPVRVVKGAYLARQGVETASCTILVDGLAHRSKVVARGHRQILGICVPGDLVDLPLILLDHIDHHVQAMTDCDVILVERDRLRVAAFSNPDIARDLWTRSFIDTAIAREWQANIGRRNATMRMAHFICELRYRLTPGKPTKGETFELPLSQCDFADVLGLTPVHINRVLRELEERRLIQRDRRNVTVPCWNALSRSADFNPAYLYGAQQTSGRPAWAEALAHSAAARTG